MLWAFGPRETVDTTVEFTQDLSVETVEQYFADAEAAFDDIVPGTEKRVIWAAAAKTKTPLSVLYIHGFSATSEEIRPVPDKVAEALGANLVFTRLNGHGRSEAAMAEPSAGDWLYDTAEALAAARAVGDEVIVISTSTGGTLAALAALDPELSKNVLGTAMVSANFAVNNPMANMLTWPAVRWWGPLIAGAERGFTPANEANAKYWTYRYPTVSVLPMAALLEHAKAQDFSAALIPALFLYSPDDQVVKPDEIERVAKEWGAPVVLAPQNLPPGNDVSNHVIAGDILSPGMTDVVVQAILDWAGTL